MPNDTAMPTATARAVFEPRVLQFLDTRPPRFGVIATLNEDGSPHQAVVWYLVTAEGLVVNSAAGRRWPANLQRDPRASLLVEDGYSWVSVRGEADPIGDAEAAQADIAAMARLYHADDPAGAERMIERTFRPQRRLSFRLRPASVSADLED